MIRAEHHTATGTKELTSETWQDDILHAGYDAFIFDCDGTLVESAEVHFTSFQEAAAAQGFILDKHWYLARTGLDRESLFREFAREVAVGFDIGEASEHSILRFIEISDRVLPIAETKQLVNFLHRNFPLAVGTNAEKQVAEASLRATNMFNYFDHIVSVTDGMQPKPSPEIFAKAAKLLGQPPNKTLVIEDSDEGVMAAKTAGIDVIKIKSEK
jgi:beta-phosphoglucomutase-like phosphatase (HAD superfamily)